MLQSKKGNMIISLILAIALWMYVVGETNPEVTKSFRSIPITLENTQTLADSGLAVVRSSDETVSVTLSGRRSIVNRIKSTDIVATADLSDAVDGDNQIRVDVKIPSEVEIRDQSPSKITVTVEERVTEEKEIRAVYNGTAADDTEATTTAIEPATVEVTGARSRVDKVSYVGALCDMADIQENETSIRCRLTPMNADGNEVENITLSQNKAVVNTILYHKKEVDLAVDVTGKDEGGYERTYEVPKRVNIKGTLDDIAEITGISCRGVDLSDVTKSGKIKLQPILPDGIELADDSSRLVMKVNVEKSNDRKDEEDPEESEDQEVKTTSFVLTNESIEIDNVGEGLKAVVPNGNVRVSVAGTDKELEIISADSVALRVDCTGLEAGTHTLNIDVSVEGEHGEVSCAPQTITLEITEER